MKTLQSLFISLAIIISCVGSTFLFVNYKTNSNTNIYATGSAEVDFTADLIVWRGKFTSRAQTSKEAYNKIKSDSEIVKNYLISNEILDSEMVFNSVDINEDYVSNYDSNGRFVSRTLVGYELSQDVTITSDNIEKVEKVSRDVSSLLEAGVEFTSYSPEYYCSKLDEIKLDLIRKATTNAKERINIMAEEAGAHIGKLINSRLGVFQIVAKNSGTSNYSYDGYFDTSSKNKTASITVRLEYSLN